LHRIEHVTEVQDDGVSLARKLKVSHLKRRSLGGVVVVAVRREQHINLFVPTQGNVNQKYVWCTPA
jgi:hypothetical protein